MHPPPVAHLPGENDGSTGQTKEPDGCPPGGSMCRRRMRPEGTCAERLPHNGASSAGVESAFQWLERKAVGRSPLLRRLVFLGGGQIQTLLLEARLAGLRQERVRRHARKFDMVSYSDSGGVGPGQCCHAPQTHRPHSAPYDALPDRFWAYRATQECQTDSPQRMHVVTQF